MKIQTHTISHGYGKLKSVYALNYEIEGQKPMIVALQLVFEYGQVFHEALGETDEITCNSSLIEGSVKKIEASQNEPWRNAVGREVLWLWEMKNHQGYNDALQYQFANSVSDSEVIIQLVVRASEVYVYESKCL